MFERSYETYITIDKDLDPKIFLYIPFSEQPEELYSTAKSWQNSIATSAKKYKTPEIVLHKNINENLGHQGFDVISKFDINAIPKNSVIYVLGHGFGDPCEIANSVYLVGSIKLSAKSIVQRLISDGFTPELAKKIKALSLYVCDKNGANKYFAYNVAGSFGKDYDFLSLNYYEATMALPESPSNEQMSTYKYAVKELPISSQTVQPANTMRANNKLYELLGRASNLKKTVKVGEVLRLQELASKEEKKPQQTNISINTNYNRFFSFNPAALIMRFISKDKDNQSELRSVMTI